MLKGKELKEVGWMSKGARRALLAAGRAWMGRFNRATRGTSEAAGSASEAAMGPFMGKEYSLFEAKTGHLKA